MIGRPGAGELRERIAGLMGQARAELAELVAIPSVADPRQFCTAMAPAEALFLQRYAAARSGCAPRS